MVSGRACHNNKDDLQALYYKDTRLPLQTARWVKLARIAGHPCPQKEKEGGKKNLRQPKGRVY
eukprot:1136681-Pelagomonas_calceolata.AAC.3